MMGKDNYIHKTLSDDKFIFLSFKWSKMQVVVWAKKILERLDESILDFILRISKIARFQKYS